MTSRDPTYCQTDDYVPRLVERQFRTGGSSDAGPASESLWVPEFSALADGRYPERMRALKAVAGQVDKAAADEERARDRIEATVVALVSSMVGDAGGGVADQVLARMKETVLKAVVRDGRERVSMWLRLNAAARPRAVDAILGIEPELKLESPRLAMAAAGGAEAFVARTWNEEHHPTVSLEKLGRDAAIQHQKDVEQQQRDAETARIAAAEARERAEVARRARGPRIR